MTQESLVDREQPSSGERKLWHAVINQMIADGLNTSASLQATRDRNTAREWFTLRRAGYRYVCDLADIADADKLADQALALFAKADKTPAKPARKPSCSRGSITIEHDGVTKSVSEWAAQYGMPADVLRCRVFRLGWTFEDAVSRPRRQRRGVRKAPGVGQDFKERQGTGGGSTTRDRAELEFS